MLTARMPKYLMRGRLAVEYRAARLLRQALRAQRNAVSVSPYTTTRIVSVYKGLRRTLWGKIKSIFPTQARKA